MNILVTGASGMLGYHLANFLSEKYQVFGIGQREIAGKFKYQIFNLAEQDYSKIINWSNPNLIIHCAAITDSNYCENNPMEAFEINAFSNLKLINSTSIKTKIIYISTDAVFSYKNHLASEDDATNPQNYYGKSKELGEFILRNSNRNHLIIRTTIFGEKYKLIRKESFVDWIINSSKSKNKITLFDDVIFSPISIWDLIYEIDFLIQNPEINNEIFHICSSDYTTKFEFGIELLKSIPNLNTNYILRGSILDFNKRANRSTDQTMNNSKYEIFTKRKLPKVKETIITFLKIQKNEKY